MKKISTSCDPDIEHVIFDCNEVVHWHNDVYLKSIYLEKSGCEGRLIGIAACEEDGTLIENGLILVLEEGVFIRQGKLNKKRLSFVDMDAEGKIKIAR